MLNEQIQVMPLNDLREHIQHQACKCQPTIDGNLIVHHSFDGREFFEEDGSWPVLPTHLRGKITQRHSKL